MATNPQLTWYDVLGVPHDATPERIKAAWRDATDKFEPGSGSGQFRMFNDAADVLLDPARRAEYDASLAAGDAPASPVAPPAPPPPAPEAAATPVAADAPAPAAPEGEKERRRSRRKPARPRRAPRTPASRAALLVAAVLALLGVVALVAAVVLGLKVRTESRVADARDEAPASAEQAAKVLLSYDYRTLPADRRRASAYLTPDFRAKYLKNFSLLEKQKDGTPGAAVQTKTIVTSSVLGSGVVDAEDGVVRVLVYVNQTSKKPGVDPQIFQNRVAMTMEKDGGRWLVDDLKSY